MSERYKRIPVRLKSPRGAVIGLVLIFTSLLASVLFTEYLAAQGLEDSVGFIKLGTVSLPLRIALLPSIGLAFLLVAAWAHLAEETAYAKTALWPKQEESALSIRLLKTATIVTALFTSVLFLPYLLGSMLFLRFLGIVTTYLGFLEPYARSAVSVISTFSAFSENVKYLLSVNLTAFIVLVVTLLLARQGRTPSRKRR
jgi:hypothetical protein